jgi:hypothetical protein
MKKYQKINKLPPFWRRKETPTGQTYYYNTESNQTTYDLEQVMKTVFYINKTVQKRRSLMWKADEVVANTEQKALPSPTHGAIPGPKSLLKNSAVISWELLINNILKTIADLNYSAKNDIKSLYIQQCSQIVCAIRDMLACSGMFLCFYPFYDRLTL